ncbi:MAG: hypothetical protein HY000_08775 [Planctomycetes bacterium]|nr:hypothetical protein [Planctomycetota bacterium]
MASRVLALVVYALWCQACTAGVVAPNAAPAELSVLTLDPAGGLFLSNGSAPRRIAVPLDGNTPVVESQPTIEIVIGGPGGLRLSDLRISNVLGRVPGGIFAFFADGVERVIEVYVDAAGEVVAIAALAAGDTAFQQRRSLTSQNTSLATTIGFPSLGGPVTPYEFVPNLKWGLRIAPPTALVFVPATPDDARKQAKPEESAGRKIKKSIQVAGSTTDPLATSVAVALVLVYACLIWNLR